MTLDLKKNKNIQRRVIKTKTQPIKEQNSSRSAITKLTKENYEKLQKLTGTGFSKIYKK